MTDVPLLERAIAALQRGEIIGMPTDTVYGIAASPWDSAAVARLFAAKGRHAANPIPILIAGIEQAGTVALLDGAAVALAEKHWPGALTLVVPRAADVPEWIGDPESGSVGVRVPDHATALELLNAAGPLAVTSANPTGAEPARDDASARRALGGAVSVYVSGRGGGGAASTVVDLLEGRPQILRSGPVAVEG